MMKTPKVWAELGNRGETYTHIFRRDLDPVQLMINRDYISSAIIVQKGMHIGMGNVSEVDLNGWGAIKDKGTAGGLLTFW